MKARRVKQIKTGGEMTRKGTSNFYRCMNDYRRNNKEGEAIERLSEGKMEYNIL
jgi:hypothetical protein